MRETGRFLGSQFAVGVVPQRARLRLHRRAAAYPDGEPTFNEGYNSARLSTGDLIPARVLQAPWLTHLEAKVKYVALTLETPNGTVHIDGETILSTHHVYHDDNMFSSQALMQLYMSAFRRCSRPVCGINRDGEEAFGMLEWLNPLDQLIFDISVTERSAQRRYFAAWTPDTKLHPCRCWCAEWPLAVAAVLFLVLFSRQVLAQPHGLEAHIVWGGPTGPSGADSS